MERLPSGRLHEVQTPELNFGEQVESLFSFRLSGILSLPVKKPTSSEQGV